MANLQDIIASKKASGRIRDRLDLPLLELFRQEFEKRDWEKRLSGNTGSKTLP
ncbi:MAG: hypothetical protein ACR2OZ_02380 [Verrucomicrobiales bacterium]